MISVADLLSTSPNAPGSFYAANSYVRSDLELGLLENRSGSRLLAIPDTLIKALYAGLEQETGLAARLVLANCGRWWGKNFYQRFSEDLSKHSANPSRSYRWLNLSNLYKNAGSVTVGARWILSPRWPNRDSY